LRAGAGLVTLSVPASALHQVDAATPEVMAAALPETAEGSFSRLGANGLKKLVHERDALAIGPGISTHPEVRELVMDVLEEDSFPAVVDADALNVLEGDLEHKDNMGNTEVIRQGDVQVMSAGTGVYHSEYNKNQDRRVKFLQIWLFPREKNVQPRYDKVTIAQLETENEFTQILSPDPEDQGAWIHQDAWFHIGTFKEGTQQTCKWKRKENGLYIFVLEGNVMIAEHKLQNRDGLGIWEASEIDITADSNARLLLMEIPMH
jgi:hypothetical protein